MENETEQRWYSGKEEYNVEEIEHMLESQRAKIYNDVRSILWTVNGHNRSAAEKRIVDYLKNPRKVKI